MQQMTTHYVKDTFNLDKNYPWPSSVPVFVMAGTGGSDGFATEDASFGVRITKILSDWNLPQHGSNDGVVLQHSVAGQYAPLPFDLFVSTSVDLGPNVVTDKQALSQSLDHLTLISAPKAIQWITGILQSGNLPAPLVSNFNLSAGLKLNTGTAKSSNAPTLPTVQFDRQAGTLAQGEIKTFTVACDASSTFTVGLLSSAGGSISR